MDNLHYSVIVLQLDGNLNFLEENLCTLMTNLHKIMPYILCQR